jgi:hypothetical protein
VELFLNLIWLSVSLLLVTWWIGSVRRGRAKVGWGAVIALTLLLVLLFPVISMTDDLVAINTSAEVEHMMRRYEAPLMQIASFALLDAVALFAMVMVGIASSGKCFTRIRPHAFAAKLLAGFVRASGDRPPPVMGALAA